MKLETKLLLFYLTMDDKEKSRFKSLIGPRAFEKMLSPISMDEVGSVFSRLGRPTKSIDRPAPLDFDIAIMQLVRHIVERAPSNIELANSIEEVVGHKVSRPEKRSKYELQGMLLEALMSAPKERLLNLRKQLAHGHILGKGVEQDSNLDRWFSIILGNRK